MLVPATAHTLAPSPLRMIPVPITPTRDAMKREQEMRITGIFQGALSSSRRPSGATHVLHRDVAPGIVSVLVAEFTGIPTDDTNVPAEDVWLFIYCLVYFTN